MAEEYVSVALSPIRKVIAARMTEAVRTIPHFRVTSELEVDALIELRKELGNSHPHATLSLNDLLVKACALALTDVPSLNVQWHEGEIRRYRSADVAVVTALEDGLSTPIVRRAESKSVFEISREVKELIARAARNALRLDEVFGGTFSISNLGMHGVDQFDAIINPPQCAILAVGRAAARCIVSVSREFRVATVLRATLAVDHRALDGALAARFISALRARLEQPASLLAEGPPACEG